METRIIEVHPNILELNGKKQFAILPYDEFESIMEALAEYEDLRELRDAKAVEENETSVPLQQVRQQLGI